MTSPQLHDLPIAELYDHTKRVFKDAAFSAREAEAAKKAAVGQAELAEATAMTERRRKKCKIAEQAMWAASRANSSRDNVNIYTAERKKAITYLNNLHLGELIGDWPDELTDAGKIIKRHIRKNIKKTKRRRQKFTKRRRGATRRR